MKVAAIKPKATTFAHIIELTGEEVDCLCAILYRFGVECPKIDAECQPFAKALRRKLRGEIL